MIKIDEDKFDEEVEEKRHEDLIAELQKIAERPSLDMQQVEKTLSSIASVLAQIQKKDLSIDLTSVSESIVTGLADLKTAMSSRPKSFRVERNTAGMISKVIPEYE